MACALGIPANKSVAIQAAKAIDGSFLICALRDCFVAASGLKRLPNPGVRELPPTCRGYAHCSPRPKVFFQHELRFVDCLKSQLLIGHLFLPIKIVDQSPLLTHQTNAARTKGRSINQANTWEISPLFSNYPINFCFKLEAPRRTTAAASWFNTASACRRSCAMRRRIAVAGLPE